MTAHPPAGGSDYRQGYRAALGEVVRGLLGIEAATVEIDELIAALSRYEEAVEDWIAQGGDMPPHWQPTAEELGASDE